MYWVGTAFSYYRQQLLLRKGNVFTSICFSVHRGHAWQRGVCMAKGAYMVKGGMCGKGDIHGKGGMHGKGVMCGRGHTWGGMCGGGMHGKGDMHGRGHAWQGHEWQGLCMAGGMHGGEGRHGRRDGHCSGRYASYWNAFLFNLVFVKYICLTSVTHIKCGVC